MTGLWTNKIRSLSSVSQRSKCSVNLSFNWLGIIYGWQKAAVICCITTSLSPWM